MASRTGNSMWCMRAGLVTIAGELIKSFAPHGPGRINKNVDISPIASKEAADFFMLAHIHLK